MNHRVQVCDISPPFLFEFSISLSRVFLLMCAGDPFCWYVNLRVPNFSCVRGIICFSRISEISKRVSTLTSFLFQREKGSLARGADVTKTMSDPEWESGKTIWQAYLADYGAGQHPMIMFVVAPLHIINFSSLKRFLRSFSVAVRARRDHLFRISFFLLR